jgi:hypothetical protein
MKKIREYKGIIIIVLILISGAFYWFQLRPAFVKSFCHEKATEQAIEKAKPYGLKDKFHKDDYETYYKWCLQSKGF